MKKIPLTKGQVALVDDEDFGWLSKWKWSFLNGGYAVRVTATNQMVYMHREILGLKAGDGKYADHVNFDRLDNQRLNLRACSPCENARNQFRNKTNTSSKYKGVSWYKRKKKWCAEICLKYKRTRLGEFASELDAAIAYNKAAKKLHGEFASLNKV